MKRILLLLLVSGAAWAQQPAQPPKYSFDEFMLIEKVEDQEKYYDAMLKALPADQVTPAATNDYRGELAFSWLARGNVDRYRHYQATNPRYTARQFLYLCDALEKLDDGRHDAQVEQVTRSLLDGLEKRMLSDPVGKAQVLMELNAVSNARLGNVEAAKAMIARAAQAKENLHDMKYFRDSKASYLRRHAIVLSAAGEHKAALDMLTQALRDADSNPAMDGAFREVCRKATGTDKGCQQSLESLRAEAYRKYYREVEGNYIEAPTQTLVGTVNNPSNSGKKMTVFRSRQPVHEISISNLAGKPVALGEYRGQVLALDFWSTLCTPCVAAFAGFQRVVAEYGKQDFQMFVVDLFETPDIVRSYVAKKGITLDVLTDEGNKAYDVQATPTKIIFDPAGNIRFYGIGYAGSTDREYYKLKAMIEITRARYGGGEGAVGTPAARSAPE